MTKDSIDSAINILAMIIFILSIPSMMLKNKKRRVKKPKFFLIP
jgi:hypothetical protein